MNWVPLHLHSDGSLLDGLSKSNQIAKRCADLGYGACAITDHGSISNIVSFIKSIDKAGIKPILGNEFYLCKEDSATKTKENRKLSHLVVLAKNLNGWKSLIKATSYSNSKENFYYKPRLDLEKFRQFAGNLVSFSGHAGSDLANVLFKNPSAAYSSRTKEEVESELYSDAKERAIKLAQQYTSIFGKGNFYLEIQLIDAVNLPAMLIIVSILRDVSLATGIPCVATADSHYPTKEDAEDQRVLICSALKITRAAAQRKVDNLEDITLGGFFRSNNYHIPNIDELSALHTEAELQNAIEIANSCDKAGEKNKYEIFNKPQIPAFTCPDGKSPEQHLTEMCESGWYKVPNGKEQIYRDRLQYELKVINDTNLLASYFLIVQDYVQAAKNRGELIGPGRGSAGGCLVSYLIGVTQGLDPIQYDLIFERFYNAGRNAPGRIALPDIDTDFEKNCRHNTVEYLESKFGHDKVTHMATFGRMQGRGALKDVLRAYETCSFNEMNEITEFIPDEAKIADDLQAMREERDGEASIIQWALENNAKELRKWVWLKDDGTIDGEGTFPKRFAQAIRLEGTKRNIGQHASGIIVSRDPLAEICPMVNVGGDKYVAGMQMNDLEALGLVKFDILGVGSLDRINGVVKMLKQGKWLC
jgi:DNA polymerase III subunit alpha